MRSLCWAFAALLPSALLLSGCADELNCSGLEARRLVEQIAHDEFEKSVGPNRDLFAGRVSFSLSDIVTTDKANSKTACKAKLIMTVKSAEPTGAVAESNLNITYHVEKTDEGRLYVTVFGL